MEGVYKCLLKENEPIKYLVICPYFSILRTNNIKIKYLYNL